MPLFAERRWRGQGIGQGPRSTAELDFVEREQVGNAVAGLLRVREFAWFQYRSGIMDEAAMRSYVAPLARWLRRGDAGAIWAQVSQEMDPEFVEYVEQVLDETSP